MGRLSVESSQVARPSVSVVSQNATRRLSPRWMRRHRAVVPKETSAAHVCFQKFSSSKSCPVGRVRSARIPWRNRRPMNVLQDRCVWAVVCLAAIFTCSDAKAQKPLRHPGLRLGGELERNGDGHGDGDGRGHHANDLRHVRFRDTQRDGCRRTGDAGAVQ